MDSKQQKFNTLRLQPKGSPLYYQIATLIRSQIDKGQLRPMEKIPTESELTEIYGVSRVTVRQAVSLLVADGYLVRKVPKGTFVGRNRPLRM